MCKAEVGRYGTFFHSAASISSSSPSCKVDACFCEIAHIGAAGLVLDFVHSSRSISLWQDSVSSLASYFCVNTHRRDCYRLLKTVLLQKWHLRIPVKVGSELFTVWHFGFQDLLPFLFYWWITLSAFISGSLFFWWYPPLVCTNILFTWMCPLS